MTDPQTQSLARAFGCFVNVLVILVVGALSAIGFALWGGWFVFWAFVAAGVLTILGGMWFEMVKKNEAEAPDGS